MSAPTKRRVTPQEYLAIERQAQFKSEYYHGEMYAMAGACYSHNRVLANLLSKIGNQLDGKDCFMLPNDMRVRVPDKDSYFYPDAIIVCGKPEFEDSVFDTLLNPRVIFEVLSDSTEQFDRGKKFDEYCKFALLQEYVLVSQSKMQVQRFVRRSEDHWDLHIFKDVKSDFSLETIPVTIALNSIYEGIDFTQIEAEAK